MRILVPTLRFAGRDGNARYVAALESYMGTNYYLKIDPCPHCGRSDKRLHIGKSGAGWCFSLHVMPEDGIDDLDDWCERWATGAIENEYDEPISVEEMCRIITDRVWTRDRESWESWLPAYQDEAHFHRLNHSERGPNGLLRHQLGAHCVKHGSGTWDCIPGEFS